MNPEHREHGRRHLAGFKLDSYSLELKEDGGFVGDRARGKVLGHILEELRERERRSGGDDPLGDASSHDRREVDDALRRGDRDAASVVHDAADDFADELVAVIERFLTQPSWRDTEHAVVGGGLSESRVGRRVVDLANDALGERGLTMRLSAIRTDPDEAALLGALHLCPPALLDGHDAVLTVDIGGTNMRAGLVTRLCDRDSGCGCGVAEMERRRHEKPSPSREEAVERLCGLLRSLIARAQADGLRLAPFVGIGCPGVIEPCGRISGGAQNLPGDWEARDFNLPGEVRWRVPEIAGAPTLVVLHNDAVLQGLGEADRMRGHRSWGVLTIGTGLGNARYSRHAPGPDLPPGWRRP